jgi:cobalamin biosynthesis protein CobT
MFGEDVLKSWLTGLDGIFADSLGVTDALLDDAIAAMLPNNEEEEEPAEEEQDEEDMSGESTSSSRSASGNEGQPESAADSSAARRMKKGEQSKEMNSAASIGKLFSERVCNKSCSRGCVQLFPGPKIVAMRSANRELPDAERYSRIFANLQENMQEDNNMMHGMRWKYVVEGEEVCRHGTCA